MSRNDPFIIQTSLHSLNSPGLLACIENKVEKNDNRIEGNKSVLFKGINKMYLTQQLKLTKAP